MLHGTILETVHTVDLNALAECYDKEKSSIAIKATFTSSRPSGYQPRATLPSGVARAISVLRNERACEALEEKGAYLIMGAQFPYLIIGATRKWTQITGFLLSDILARDISFLEGAQSNKVLFRYICSEACRGRAAHAVITHYRRDGSAFVNSVHSFPVYDGNHVIIKPLSLDDDSSSLQQKVNLCNNRNYCVNTLISTLSFTYYILYWTIELM